MNLFPFLCFSVIFCALVMVVDSKGARANKIAPTVLIGAEVYLLLLYQDIAGAPFGSESGMRTVLCAVVAVAALADFLRLSEKSFPLLAVFASLVQLLVSLGVVEGVSF
ncbi:MAG: hypothetical protein HY812_18615 [Planctomycetes bacterium]|nr:hypothetical protein [Planctomycetota bacterium]